MLCRFDLILVYRIYIRGGMLIEYNPFDGDAAAAISRARMGDRCAAELSLSGVPREASVGQ